MPDDTMARARRVRFLTCDVDGVLTDGKIYMDDLGHQMKAFSSLDGVGLNLLARAGIAVAWITGSAAPAVTHRARMLNVAHVVLDTADKLAAWETLRNDLGFAADACAHIGDDLPDVPVFRACGFAVAVPNAPASVREHAHHVTTREGGAGAVRELADLILAAQGATFAGMPPRAA
jgi:3-deoxy-D-manno-octulosonate 8-phosphate phosphatase (KDO 8-P phosphatase)